MTKGILQLDETIIIKLEALVHGTNQTPEEFISAIVNGLSSNRSEDAARLAEAEARWMEFERTGKAVPLNEIIEWINSWGTPDRKPAPQCRA
jgi:predicted transcriptional regulator